MFSKVLEFIYFGKVPYLLDNKAWSHIENLDRGEYPLAECCLDHDEVAGTYLMADKMCVEPLMNGLHDLYRKYHRYIAIDGVTLQMITEKGPQDGLLRDWTLRSIAVELRRWGWDEYKTTNGELWDDFLGKSLNNGIDLLKALTDTSREDDDEYWGKIHNNPDPCRWHVHIETPRCDA